MDARDQVLEHKFDFLIPFDTEEILKNDCALTGTDLHDNIYKKMHKFLVEAVSNVASAAFKFLNREELTETEAKEYASKNVLLNVNSFFRQMSYAISVKPKLNAVIEQKKLDEFRLRLLKEMDSLLESILTNLADSYPMAPATGGSQKMRQNVQDINRTDNEAYDLIFANKISIEEHINEKGDYTKFIMEVINAAIRATQNCKEDSRDRTYVQMYEQFNKKLQWAVKNQDFQELLKRTEDETRGDEQ